MTSKCSCERKSHTSFTLSQKLEMIKLSEEGISKVEVAQVVNAQAKFLNEIKTATLVKT